ncbi:MAG: YicC family protein [Rhodospirillaceae bacterium]|nr:YicC family protein [Rhodospirillaceae bacterium]
MNISSMTGFATSEGSNEKCAWVWEGKSVNAKGLDVRLKFPRGFDFLEAKIREAANKQFTRGNIYINLDVSWVAVNSGVALNVGVLDSILDALVTVQKNASTKGISLSPPTADGILGLRGVLEQNDEHISDEDRLEMERDIMAGLQDMIDGLAQNRKSEGANLALVMGEQVNAIEKLCSAATKVSATQPDKIKSRLKEQIEKLIADVPAIDASRLATEAAVLMTKADILEELDRLCAHVAATRDLLGGGGPVGRRLDFICQEFNREANTLCSKSSDVELTNIGLELKSVIEQFREQVQNIE